MFNERSSLYLEENSFFNNRLVFGSLKYPLKDAHEFVWYCSLIFYFNSIFVVFFFWHWEKEYMIFTVLVWILEISDDI